MANLILVYKIDCRIHLVGMEEVMVTAFVLKDMVIFCIAQSLERGPTAQPGEFGTGSHTSGQNAAAAFATNCRKCILH